MVKYIECGQKMRTLFVFFVVFFVDIQKMRNCVATICPSNVKNEVRITHNFRNCFLVIFFGEKAKDKKGEQINK